MYGQTLNNQTRYKRYLSTKVLVRSSILVALSIILSRFFGILVPIAGLPGLKVSFGAIPLKIIAILFGPLAGALAGTVADLVGFMMNPMGGAYFPGFTLSAALSGAITGYIFKVIRSNKFKVNFNIVNAVTILVLSGGVVKALFIKNILRYQEGVFYYQENKLSMVYVILYAMIVLAFILIPVLLSKWKKSNDSMYSLDKLLFIVTLSYIVISIALNTYWLSIMFNKGFMVFLPTRIIAAFIKIPINALILFSLSKYFKYLELK